MKTLLQSLVVLAVLIGVVVLVYRRRPGELLTDIRTLFSHRLVYLGLPALAVAVAGFYYWTARGPEVPPPAQPGAPVVESPASPPAPAPASTAAAPAQDISALYRKIGPSVVAVYTYGERSESIGRGSGFFLGSSGHVVTNLHVLRGAHSAQIKTAGGRLYPVLGLAAKDIPGDLALLAVKVPWNESVPLSVSAAVPQVGEQVVVVGSPFGLEQSVSDGIVSAIRETGQQARVLQITAPISPGSSGSPVVNMRGELVGVAFSQVSRGQNLNFGIAAERVSRLAGASGPPVTLAGGAAASGIGMGRQTYCYLDEKGSVRFSEAPPNPRYRYQVISGPDGSLDRDRFEHWVFEQIGGNPQDIDPQAAVVRAREELPDVFRRTFQSQYALGDLPKMPQEAQNHWQRVANLHLANAYNGALQKRNKAVLQYRVMMDAFQLYMMSRGQ